MIDLHNHILPGVDDGAANLAESVAIARQFVKEGVRAVAATPHLDPLHGTGPSPDEVRTLVAEVRAILQASDVDLEVHPGNELFLTPAAADLLKEGKALPLAGSRHVVVEVSLTALERPIYLDDSVFRIQLGGFQPILAHPERYPFAQRDIASLDTLLARGVVFQLTAPSLLGEYGPRVRRTAERLLKCGAYALAASDRHHPGSSRSLLRLHARLTELQGIETADLLLRVNPTRVLEGHVISRPDVDEDRSPHFMARLFGWRA